MERVFETARNADEQWRELTGRGYGIVEKYKVTMPKQFC